MSAAAAAAALALLAAATIVILAEPASMAHALPGVLSRLLPAILVNAAAAAIGWMEDAITPSGAAAGALLGVVIYLGAGWEGWALLVATFACAVVTSNVGWERKQALGIAEARGGRRSAGQAIANCGMAACCAVVAISSPYQSEAWVGLAAALAAAGADTSASEIGKARGGRTVLVTTWRPVAPGTDGGISVAGSLANIAAAAALGVLAAAVGLIAARDVFPVLGAAAVGSTADSLIGATLESKGLVTNDVTNFINTAVAAGLAVYLSS